MDCASYLYLGRIVPTLDRIRSNCVTLEWIVPRRTYCAFCVWLFKDWIPVKAGRSADYVRGVVVNHLTASWRITYMGARDNIITVNATM